MFPTVGFPPLNKFGTSEEGCCGIHSAVPNALIEAGQQWPSGKQMSPEHHALQAELSEAIARGLATLPEELRLALILVDVQGLSYEEVALVMGSPTSTVKSRLSRARTQF